MEKQENPSSPILSLSLPLPKDHDFMEIDLKNKKGSYNNSYSLVKETKKQVWLAGPLIIVGLLTFSLHVNSLMFVGHLGNLPLAAASLATSFAYVTGFSVLLGMASALETVCGQSYGAKQYKMVGVHTQRAMLVLCLVSVPISITWYNTKYILIVVGQDHMIASEAASYVKSMIPGLIPYGLIQCLFRYFQTQNMVFPMILSSGITTLLHIIICWSLVFTFSLGSRGAAIANVVSYWINLMILALYVQYSLSCSKTWNGFSIASLQGIPTFLRLSIPSTAMLCLEFWSFEMVILLSGYLSNPVLETSALSICLNLITLVWVIHEGLSGGVSTRVSNELGASNPQCARLAVHVALSMTICECILVGLLLMMLRDVWGYAYTQDLEVVKYLATMMPLIVIANFLTGVTCILYGIARGCGWQKIGAYINLTSFYLIGLPISILLAFLMHIGGKGLWLGFISAFLIQVLSLSAITINTNWEKEAKKATIRVFGSNIPEDESQALYIMEDGRPLCHDRDKGSKVDQWKHTCNT
ncbi:protein DETOXIFICATION 16-like [Chenopodium quinoa]|uniref:protein DETOXIFICATION 16-like n=1 Tax=Chenopodium quinoa TaxID=63459 RepID=UPI000B79A2EF|nr:protein DETOXIFICATION 16-like [Chenopodium quinoa]